MQYEMCHLHRLSGGNISNIYEITCQDSFIYVLSKVALLYTTKHNLSTICWWIIWKNLCDQMKPQLLKQLEKMQLLVPLMSHQVLHSAHKRHGNFCKLPPSSSTIHHVENQWLGELSTRETDSIRCESRSKQRHSL